MIKYSYFTEEQRLKDAIWWQQTAKGYHFLMTDSRRIDDQIYYQHQSRIASSIAREIMGIE